MIHSGSITHLISIVGYLYWLFFTLNLKSFLLQILALFFYNFSWDLISSISSSLATKENLSLWFWAFSYACSCAYNGLYSGISSRWIDWFADDSPFGGILLIIKLLPSICITGELDEDSYEDPCWYDKDPCE